MSEASTVIQKHKIRNLLVFIAILLLVIIPKGGFKIAGIPITWGYLYLGFLGTGCIFLLSPTYPFNKRAIACYLATLPFLFYFIIHISVIGFDSSIGNLIAFFVSYMFMPLLFLVLLAGPLGRVDKHYLENLICKAVVVVSVYGLVLFVYKQVLGYYIEIPYITINAADAGTLENKYNQRGDIFKLISTYNNGNIFGVCILFLFPVFYRRHKNIFQLCVVLLALLLTLSRTVWIGVIIFFLIEYRSRLVKLVKVYLFIGVLLFLLGSFVFTQYFQYGSMENFLLDTSFGGRLRQIREAFQPTLFGIEPFENIDEVVYLSIYRQFGIIGFLLFLISFLAPIFIYADAAKDKDKAYFIALIIYCVLCMSDGCTLLIPTLAIYNFVICMAFTKYSPQQ